MKFKIKLTKHEWQELKRTQAIVAKKAQDPNFFKSVPKAEYEANRIKM